LPASESNSQCFAGTGDHVVFKLASVFQVFCERTFFFLASNPARKMVQKTLGSEFKLSRNSSSFTKTQIKIVP